MNFAYLFLTCFKNSSSKEKVNGKERRNLYILLSVLFEYEFAKKKNYFIEKVTLKKVYVV